MACIQTWHGMVRVCVCVCTRSLDDYMRHFESKHLGALVDYTEDKDITWIIHPLVSDTVWALLL